MQPSPMAETSSLLFPSVRVFTCFSPLPKRPSGRSSVVLPSDSPVLVRVRRLHDQLSSGQLEQARQVLAHEAPDQGTFDVKRELARAFVNVVPAEGGLVPTLRVLHRPRGSSCLLVSVHDLDGHAALGREDEESGAVRAVNGSICALLFEP